MSEQEKTSNMNNEQQARRKLLQMATYVPPAILGVMLAGNKVAEAGVAVPIGGTKICTGGGGTIIVSAGGNACCPCVSTDTDFNTVKCNWKRCELGNCAACPTGPYKDAQQCAKVAVGCGCTCTSPNGNKNTWTCN